MIKCVNYNEDVSAGQYSINATTLFAAQLSTIDRILLVSHPKRSFKVVPGLSTRVSKTVSFKQIISVNPGNAVVSYTFANIERINGQICILAQGNSV